MLEAPEYIELLILLAQFLYLREYIVACLYGICHSMTAYVGIVVRIAVLVFVVGPVCLVV